MLQHLGSSVLNSVNHAIEFFHSMKLQANLGLRIRPPFIICWRKTTQTLRLVSCCELIQSIVCPETKIKQDYWLPEACLCYISWRYSIAELVSRIVNHLQAARQPQLIHRNRRKNAFSLWGCCVGNIKRRCFFYTPTFLPCYGEYEYRKPGLLWTLLSFKFE